MVFDLYALMPHTNKYPSLFLHNILSCVEVCLFLGVMGMGLCVSLPLCHPLSPYACLYVRVRVCVLASLHPSTPLTFPSTLVCDRPASSVYLFSEH